MPLDDTIVALATPPGRGGIGVVRLAGPEAIAIAQPLLRLKRGLEPARATFAELIEPSTGERLDEVIVTWFEKPHSYTTDSMVEIAAHGSVLILDAGTHYKEPANPGVGVPSRRALATQMNLGTWLPDSKDSPRGDLFFAYPMYMDQSNPFASTAQREAKVVGGGSFVNVGAWLRPRRVALR